MSTALITPSTLEQSIENKIANSQTSQSGVWDNSFKRSYTEVGLEDNSLIQQKENEVIKSEADNMIYMLPKGMYSYIKSEEAILITRTHYTKEIISELNWIANNHIPFQTSAITGFRKLFNLIQSYTNKSPKDPFTTLLRSIYQGLVFKEKWLAISAVVYMDVSLLLKSYNNRKNLSFDDIDNALIKLENLGINPTPF